MRKPTLLLPLAAALLLSCFSGEELTPKVTNNVEDWRDEVIYQLMTDRFANGDLGNDYNVDRAAPGRYHGGDFAGIEAKIPYLKALGVTTLWISPVVKNVEEDAGFSSYHGYWAQDFTSVNPHFGDMAALRHMVNAAHEAGLKVILDIVTNHVGQLFYYDINGNGRPDESVRGQYASNIEHVSEWDPDWDPRGIQGKTSLGESGPAAIRWLWQPEINRLPPLPVEFQNGHWYNRRGRVTSWQDPDQVERGDFPGGLKDLNTELPEVRDALFRVYAQWMEAADFDGFRIDTVKHVEHAAWQDFCGRIRGHAKGLGKKNFFQFGEVFDGDNAKIGSYSFNGELDTLFNFAGKFVIDDVFKRNAPTRRLADHLAARRRDFSSVPSDATGLSAQQTIVNFLDNHDVPRFLFEKNSVPALHSALAYLFFQEGIPDIYYGTEQEFDGGNDPANREDLDRSGYSTETPTFKWIARLAEVRKEHRALRRGTMEFVWATEHTGEEADAGILAFERVDGENRALVVINTEDEKISQTADPGAGPMRTGFAAGTVLRDVMTEADEVTVGTEGALTLTVRPRQVLVLVPKE